MICLEQNILSRIISKLSRPIRTAYFLLFELLSELLQSIHPEDEGAFRPMSGKYKGFCFCFAEDVSFMPKRNATSKRNRISVPAVLDKCALYYHAGPVAERTIINKSELHMTLNNMLCDRISFKIDFE